MAYAEVFEAFPSELRLPIARLVDVLRAEFEVPRADFADLKAAMQSLAEAQARTEMRVGELGIAQTRTEARMEELATAQARTEVRMEELPPRRPHRGAHGGTAPAPRPALRLDRLAVAVEELAQAQARTQEEVTLFRRTFMSQIGGLGARWGLQTEEAFRHGIRTILGEVGFTAERFLTWDATGRSLWPSGAGGTRYRDPEWQGNCGGN